jgi:toxin CcdB
MSQFAVYRNRNPRSRATFPLFLDVQSDLLADLQTRVVIPLSRSAALAKNPVSQLMPILEFDGDTYVAMTPQLAGIARAELGPLAGSLASERDTILAALDFLVTGF